MASKRTAAEENQPPAKVAKGSSGQTPSSPEPLKTRLTLDVIRRLPKVDLHRHLDGSPRLSTIIDLAQQQGVDLPAYTVDGLAEHVLVGDDCPNLEHYLRGFNHVNAVTQQPHALTRIFYECCEDAVADGIRYLELRFSPALHVNANMGYSTVLNAICDGKALAEYSLPITVNIIVCGLRHLDPEINEQLAEIAWRYKNRGVVSFDLAGPEKGFPNSDHKEAVDTCHRNLLSCTIHAGEGDGAHQVRDALRNCGAQRIGHGTHLEDDPELIAFVADREVPVECCPTSNLQTKAAASIASHPIRRFYDEGVVVVPCTDNPLMSDITLSDEYYKLHTEAGFTVGEIVRLIDNGFKSAFVDKGTRARFRAEALVDCLRILSGEGYDVSDITSDATWCGSLGVDVRSIASLIGSGSGEGGSEAAAAAAAVGGGGVPVWAPWTDPEITTDILQAMPKTDLHLRLAGSLSASFLWEKATEAGVALTDPFTGAALDSADAVAAFVTRSSHTTQTIDAAAALAISVLQSADALVAAVADVLAGCEADNVWYAEIYVCPTQHTNGDLDIAGVIDACLSGIAAATEGKDHLTARLVVACSLRRDDPVMMRAVAEAAIAVSGDIGGFALVGGSEMTVDTLPYFQSTLELLHDANVRIAVAAGNADTTSIVHAIVDGHVSRLSGAFQMHDDPELVAYLADHNMPVELGLTDRLVESTDSLASFSNHPVELFFDSKVRIVLCSFARSLYDRTLTDVYANIASAAKLSIAEVVQMIRHGFESNFLPLAERRALQARALDATVTHLRAHGFTHIFPVQFFVGKGAAAQS